MNLADLLNQEVANFTVLYTKLHNFHWNVKGIHFFEFHEKFEELYEEISEFLDQVAERLLMIGGNPLGTLSECLEKKTINEAENRASDKEMISTVISDFETLLQELREGIILAENEKDYATVDLLTQIIVKLEKHNWMLRSFLK